MRPISLEIKGINSFKNKTVINFDRMTSSGLFGIFGTTGSGKSTILDCIFLSLYGKVFRTKLPSEFINFNCKEGSVCLEFSSLEEQDRKYFKIYREYKLDDKKNVIKSARLYALSLEYFNDDANKEETSVLIAQGEDEVNAEIVKIVGFGADEFKKCIALPQGEFAQFIKDPMKTKVETIGKIFNLEEYGNQFFETLKHKIAEDEKREEYIKGVLSQFDNLDENEIDFNQREQVRLETEIKAKNKLYTAKKQELLASEKYLIVKKEQQEVDEAFSNLDEKEYLSDKKKLDILKSSYKIAPCYLRANLLNDEKKAIEDNLAKIDAQIGKLANESSLTIANQEQEKTKLLLEVASLEYKKDLLVKAKTSEDRIDKLNFRKAKLTEDLNACLNKIKELNEILIESENEYNQTSEELQNIRFKIKQNEVPAEVLSEAKNYDKLKAEKEIYVARAEELKNELNDINTKRDELIEKLTSDDAELNEFKQQLILVEDAISNVLGKQFNKSSALTTSIKEFLAMEAAIEKYVYLKQRRDELVSENTKINEICNNSLIKVKELAKKIDSIISSTKDIEERRMKILAEKDKFVEQNIIEIVKSTANEGSNCPICDATISSKPAVNDPVSLNVYNFEYENLKHRLVEILDLRDRSVSEHGQNLAVYEVFKDRRETIENSIVELNEELDKLETQYIVIKNSTDAEKLLDATKSAVQNLQSLMESYSEVSDAKQAKEKVCIKNSARLEELDRRKTMSNSEIEFNDKLIAELNIKTLKLEELFDGIDLSNLIREIEKKKALEKEYKAEETLLLEKINDQLKIKQNNFLNYEMSLVESKNIENSIKLIVAEIEENNAVIVKAKIEDNIKNDLRKVNVSLDDLKASINLLANKEMELLKSETRLKLNKASLISESILKNAEFNRAMEELDGQFKLAGIDKKEYLEIESYEEISTLENKVLTFEKNKAEALQKKQMLEKLLESKGGNENINEIRSELELLESDYINASKKLEWLKEKIQKQKETFKNITYFREELMALQAHLNRLEELFELVQGDKLLRFITEEYIIKITDAANDHLSTLTSGRYQLVYNGDYLIADNLYAGKTRSIGTLSGGETFLVSLAMAISITEALTKFKNKPLEFMFLDEGFGTLDNESLETVLNSLLHLKKSGLIIGLISHEELVKSRVPIKIEVIKASDKEGSKIK